MKILVGSLNPVKTNAAYKAFSQYFPNSVIYEFNVSSLVSNQPIGEEVFIGAENRCKALIKEDANNNIKADYFVAIESGVVQLHNNWFNVDCSCIMDREQKTCYGLSPAYCLNEQITKRLLQREELGIIIDDLYKINNSKQNGGAVALFSKGLTTRTEHCYQAILMALIQFL